MLYALDAFSGVVVFPVTAAGGLVFAVGFAAIAWREYPSRWGAVGVALAIAAVVLVNLGSVGEKPAYRPPVVPAAFLAPSPFGDPGPLYRLATPVDPDDFVGPAIATAPLDANFAFQPVHADNGATVVNALLSAGR